MRKNILTGSLFLIALAFTSCADEKKDVLLPYPNDINFEDLDPGRLTYNVPDAPFKAGDSKSGTVTINVKKENDGSFKGFAVSTKTWRSYPWTLSYTFGNPALSGTPKQLALDSTIFSVYTAPAPSQTGTYLVGNTTGGEAIISWPQPRVVEHILAANNTYTYLLATYGSRYSGTLDATTQQYNTAGTKVRNPNNPNTGTDMYGIFFLPGPGDANITRLAGEEILGKRAAGHTAADAARAANKTPDQVKADSTTAADAWAKGNIKLTVTGYVDTKVTGKVEFYLAALPNVDPANPKYNFVMDNWNKVALSSLGEVNKLQFDVSSSNPALPSYFCLDGLRLRN
ncbi:MAG: DUF4465 domain-containing protein [Pseudobacter sp.]|uniref:DUF4465 domain-containing protein n=1 Tax=Pseudobacter sp. TaxID=2045420 RepID=UPI003F80B09E